MAYLDGPDPMEESGGLLQLRLGVVATVSLVPLANRGCAKRGARSVWRGTWCAGSGGSWLPQQNL